MIPVRQALAQHRHRRGALVFALVEEAPREAPEAGLSVNERYIVDASHAITISAHTTRGESPSLASM